MHEVEIHITNRRPAEEMRGREGERVGSEEPRELGWGSRVLPQVAACEYEFR